MTTDDVTNTVPGRLSARGAERGDDVALRLADGATLTFDVWQRRSCAVAAGLTAEGVRAGDRVALWFANEELIEYAVAYVGVQMAGAVAVPVPTTLGEHHRDAVTEACEVVNGVATADVGGGGRGW